MLVEPSSIIKRVVDAFNQLEITYLIGGSVASTIMAYRDTLKILIS